MARVIYEGADITEDIELSMLSVTDNCGETPDGIDMIVADADDQWSLWRPQRGHSLEIGHDGYTSGAMKIDALEQGRGQLTLGCLSVPAARRTPHTQTWENASMREVTAELAARYGLVPEYHSVCAPPCSRIDQVGKGDFAFLAERWRLEGCSIKVIAPRLVVYDDRAFEGASPVKVIFREQFFDEPRFYTGGELWAGCVVRSGAVAGACFDASVPDGPVRTVTGYAAASQGEAERFAKNILRSINKKECCGSFPVALDVTIAAGNTVEVRGTGMSDGVYFIEEICHHFTEEISDVKVRQVFGRF